MSAQHTPGPEDLIDMDRFIGALPSQRNRMLREARRTFAAMQNPQPDGGYPGCDVCTCPPGFCHQNAAIAKATGSAQHAPDDRSRSSYGDYSGERLSDGYGRCVTCGEPCNECGRTKATGSTS